MEVDFIDSELNLEGPSNNGSLISRNDQQLAISDNVDTSITPSECSNVALPGQLEVNLYRDTPSEHNDVNSQVSKGDHDDDDDDGALCPICLDNWTNSGEHRICALKCGHVFCYKCVYRWLDVQDQKSCPTCKKKASKADLIFIYAKKLIAIDNSELEAMRKRLDIIIEEKNRMQIDLSKYICREDILKQEIGHLKSRIHELSRKEIHSRQSEVRYNEKHPANNLGVKLYMEKSLEICRQNGCRVFDSSSILDLIIVSAKSPNNLFSGFGIRKINMSQYKPLAFVPLHNQQIRDVCFHLTNNWLLSASMDKSFKVTDANSNKVMFTSSQNMPLWSCCWDSDNQYVLYIGTQSGSLVKYDIRTINEPICTLSIPGDMSPVVSIASIPSTPGADFPHGAVISCKLNSLWMFENEGNDYKKHSLPLNGPFVSMKYHNEIRQLLVSSRPNNLVSHSRHSLCTLEKNPNGEINCNTTHTFQGGGMQKLLSKSCFISDQQEYIAAYEESNKRVFLWSINSGQKVCSIPANDAVLDLSGIQSNNGNFLVSLTERKLDFFKFQ